MLTTFLRRYEIKQQPKLSLPDTLIISFILCSRGGVENTRLEAKAKDTKKSKAKDSLSEDRHSRGQGQECPRPRTKDTSASALQKNKKKGLHKNFSGDLKKKKVFTKIFQAISTKKRVFQNIFQALHKILTIQKIMLSSSRGQANFQGLEASRPRTWPSRPRTSKCVLEDSTSDLFLIWAF